MQLPPLMLPQNQPGLERVGGCLIGFESLIWHIFSSFILYCVKALFYENITFGEPHDTYEMLWSNVACKKRGSHRHPVHIPSKDCHAISKKGFSTWIVFQEKFHLDARKKPVTLPLLLLLAASRPVTFVVRQLLMQSLFLSVLADHCKCVSHHDRKEVEYDNNIVCSIETWKEEGLGLQYKLAKISKFRYECNLCGWLWKV